MNTQLQQEIEEARRNVHWPVIYIWWLSVIFNRFIHRSRQLIKHIIVYCIHQHKKTGIPRLFQTLNTPIAFKTQ